MFCFSVCLSLPRSLSLSLSPSLSLSLSLSSLLSPLSSLLSPLSLSSLFSLLSSLFSLLSSLFSLSPSLSLSPALSQLSAYTATFGKNLLKAYEEWLALPSSSRGDLRRSQDIDLTRTDKEIFQSLEAGDLWLESRIHEVFLYLYSCKYVKQLG